MAVHAPPCSRATFLKPKHLRWQRIHRAVHNSLISLIYAFALLAAPCFVGASTVLALLFCFQNAKQHRKNWLNVMILNDLSANRRFATGVESYG